MGITSRKKRPLDRSKPGWRDTRLIVIATEGEVTEKQYFEFFEETRRLKIKVLPSRGGRSAPEYIVAVLDEYEKERDLPQGQTNYPSRKMRFLKKALIFGLGNLNF